MPTTEELSQRTAQIKAHHKRLSRTKGSGHHRDDPAAQRRKAEGQPALTDHVVAHADADDHTFVGDCATRVRTELAAFAAGHQPGDRPDPTEREAARLAKRYAEAPPAADGTLAVRNTHWNAVLHALAARGVGVTAAGVTGPVVPPDETEDD